MEYIRIEGLHPHDGRYELDLSQELTTREWGWIKRHSGYMPLTISQGLEGADPELFAVFAAIALYRAERLNQAEVAGFIDRCQDVGFGSGRIVFEGDEQPEEDDAGPPEVSSSGSSATSGDASPTSSERSGNGQKPTGIPASDSSPSDRLTWAS
jgi:hypothetical protein